MEVEQASFIGVIAADKEVDVDMAEVTAIIATSKTTAIATEVCFLVQDACGTKAIEAGCSSSTGGRYRASWLDLPIVVEEAFEDDL